MEEAFDSYLELVVLAGAGKGQHHALDRPQVVLGRQDAGDDETARVVCFPDPTVSRVHAHLEWDPRRCTYILEHRSRTNATVVNGSQLVGSRALEVGDKVKMGNLVVQLQKCTRARLRPDREEPQPLDTGLYLVALKGPAPGAILPLNYSSLILREAPQEGSQPVVSVAGAGSSQAELRWNGEEFLAHPVETGQTVRVLRCRPGCVSETAVNDPSGVRLEPGCLVVCGAAVLTLTTLQQAGPLSESLRSGEEASSLHPWLASVEASQTPCWRGAEEYSLVVLSGARRGSRLWVQPEALEGPLTLGMAPADLELPEKRAPRLELSFRGEVIELLNVDDTLSFTHNWELVTPGEEIRVVSGDRFVFERTVVSFEHGPTQGRVDGLSLFLGGAELPLLRQVNCLGYNPQSDLRIDDRRLGPTHGFVEVRPGGVFYRHKDTQSRASVRGVTVGPGQEVEILVGDVLELQPDIHVRLDVRHMEGKPGDHILIGPTQAELDAAAGRGAAAGD